MTTDTDSAAEERLHPCSWLFVALQQMKHFLLPLLLLLFAGRGDRSTLPWSMLALVIIALLSLGQYFTYRYRLLPAHIEIRSGLFARQRREIPYVRIHNVALKQNFLHRLFKVAEVRLESAASPSPEALMQVLPLPKALALEQRIRTCNNPTDATSAATGSATPPENARTLLTLDTGEIIRHGLASNRGLVLLAAALGGLGQVLPEPDVQAQWMQQTLGLASLPSLGTAQWLLLGTIAISSLVIILYCLSIVLSLLQYHGFTLQLQGRRISLQHGLISQSRSSLPKRRIQAWRLEERLPHRILRRRSLWVETSGGQASAGDGRDAQKNALAPIATAAQCDAMICQLLPQADWPPPIWQPLHRRAWLRSWLPQLLPALLLAAALGWHFSPATAIALLLPWLACTALIARKAARAAGWALHSGLVATRRGWLSRRWHFAEVEKIQSLQLLASPLDRLLGMRRLLLDTAGARPFAPLQITALPVQTAEALLQQLSAQLARRPLRW